jgi:hypothetical protein
MALVAVGMMTAFAVPAGVTAKRATSSAAACTPVSNIEAIIDDSGSMSVTDPNRLRVAALNLLISTPGNENITLGAVEFGGSFISTTPSADTIFSPQPIGPNAASMQAALDQKIHADNGTTDYNAAFTKAKADDPGAKAWIFLTDGAHNAGPYENGHRGGPPTYAIGFSSAISGTDGQRLQQIATETGGKYFPQTDSSNLQAVMNEIGTTLTCHALPVSFKDAFTKVGQRKSHAIALGSKTHSAQLTLSWASPLDAFTLSGVKVVNRSGRTVAARVRHIKVTKRQGSTFLVVKLSNLVRGSLRFKVQASKIGSGAARVNLTSQVTQGG